MYVSLETDNENVDLISQIYYMFVELSLASLGTDIQAGVGLKIRKKHLY